MDPHEMIYLPRLLVLGGLVEDEAGGLVAISSGRVKIERWTIGIPEATLPRWVLRGVTITTGRRSMQIAPDGARIVRSREATLV